MSCPVQNLSACRGATFRQDLLYTDSANVPIDISTWSATFTVGDDVYTSSSANVTIGPEAGTIHLVLSTTQVDALEIRTDYRVVLTNPGFPVGFGDTPILEGKIEVE